MGKVGDEIKLRKIEKREKTEFIGWLIDYFMEIDSAKIDWNADPVLNYPYLNSYWNAVNRFALFVEIENKIIGFVLINEWIMLESFGARYSVAEFYIQPAHRRKGIGYRVVQQIFDKWKGKWEVRQTADNSPAINFWRSCIHRYTNGHFNEISFHQNDQIYLIQTFET